MIHDLTKFLPSEFFAFSDYFCGNSRNSETTISNFTKSKKLHQSRNKHHPQYWVVGYNNFNEMPDRYIKEMVCDWYGVHRALSIKVSGEDRYVTVRDWYLKHSNSLLLHKK